jgi:hypothetical protein
LNVALPAALVFGAVTVLLVRVRAVRVTEAIIVTLFGFTLASSMFGDIIRAVFTAWFAANQPKTGVPVTPGSPIPGIGPSSTGF